jgi:hypothetical protein
VITLTNSQHIYNILFKVRSSKERKGEIPRANVESIGENIFYIIPKNNVLARGGVQVTYNLNAACAVVNNSVSIFIYAAHCLGGG